MGEQKALKRIFVLTGANRGIGLELARLLLRRGHTVIAGVRDPDRARELKELQEDHGERLSIEKLDTTSDESVKTFSEKIASPVVDVLVNNAGVYLDESDTLQGVSAGTILETYNINTVGSIRMTQALLKKLRSAQNPVVANMSSLMGSIHDNSSGGSYAYRASKAAINMFTKSLSIDEPKIIALSLHPGWVRTRMGGPSAPVAPYKSAEGLLEVIENAQAEHTGKFFNYQGQELPW